MDTILVIGGTGLLGEPVARRLHDDGWRVRVLARSPEKARQRLGSEFEIAAGDVEDPASLDAALHGCTGVHVSLYTRADPDLERRAVINVIGAAQNAGVQRFTYLSGASVREENCWYEGTWAKFQAELAIRKSGIPYTIFNAAWFMESLPRFVRGSRAVVIGRQTIPCHWVAAVDYARMVSRAYTMPEAADKALPIFGPEQLTWREALETYCAAVHPGMRVMHLPMWSAALIARLGQRDELKAALPFFHYCETATEGGDPAEANALLGAPRITLAQWSAQQAARQAD